MIEITSISIAKSASYEKDKYGEYKGSISVKHEYSHSASININLTQEQMMLIVPIISQAVAQNMSEAAEAFNQSVQAALNPPVEHEAIEAPKFDYNDDVPF